MSPCRKIMTISAIVVVGYWVLCIAWWCFSGMFWVKNGFGDEYNAQQKKQAAYERWFTMGGSQMCDPANAALYDGEMGIINCDKAYIGKQTSPIVQTGWSILGKSTVGWYLWWLSALCIIVVGFGALVAMRYGIVPMIRSRVQGTHGQSDHRSQQPIYVFGDLPRHARHRRDVHMRQLEYRE